MNKYMTDLKIIEKIDKVNIKVNYTNIKINNIENKLDKLNYNIKLIYEYLLLSKVNNDFKCVENKNIDKDSHIDDYTTDFNLGNTNITDKLCIIIE